MGKSGGPITKDDTSVEYYGTIFALTESHHQENVLWAGTDDGRVHVTRNGGNTWTDVTPSGLPEWAQINSIDIHPYEPGGAYLAATRYKLDDFRPYLYRTTDWGRSWTRITNGIPNSQFTRVLRADPDREGLLYAGTEWGVYYSLDDGANWESLQLNLPFVSVTDLQVKEQDLIAATQGRGFWILDDLSVLHQITDRIEGSAAHLYSPRPAIRLSVSERDDEPVSAGTNPHPGVSFYYSLAAEPATETEVSLAVFAGDDDEAIWTWTRKPAPSDEDDEEEDSGPNAPPDTEVLTTDTGLNRHVWDLIYPGMDRFDDLIMWADMKTGPTAVPGAYRARLTVGDQAQDVKFDVVPDPRSSTSPADYAAQFNFIMESRVLLSRAHNEIARVRQLRTQLEALQARLEADGEDPDNPSPLGLEIIALTETIDSIEEALYQTQNESRQDPLNYPIRLNNKLTSLMRIVAVGDSRPTTQAEQVKSELGFAIETQLDGLQVVWDERLPSLNNLIKDRGINMIAINAE
jgi:hypothetical protein